MDKKLNNYLTLQFNKIVTEVADTKSYAYLYEGFDNDLLRVIFPVLHCNLVAGFSSMNQRLPTGDNEAHFWAANSRGLLDAINNTLSLFDKLKGTDLEFSIDDDYHKTMLFCKSFLKNSGGSLIPPHTAEIEIYETIEIFLPKELAKSDVVRVEVAKVKEKFGTAYIHKQIELMYDNVEKAPFDAIGKAKELIETCCIEILTEMGEDISKIKDDMTKLATHTLEVLNLRASKVDDAKKGANEIKRILGGLNQIAVGIAELRNSYGSGHGKGKDFSGLTPRHARLAVGSAANLVNFLWETYELKKVGKL